MADRGLDPAHLAAAGQALLEPHETARTRPLAAMPGLSQPALAPWWPDWIGHDSRDEYWEALRHSDDYSRYEIPMYHVGGWFDIFGIGTVRNFRGMSAASPAAHHLLMGPWSHAYYDRYLGERDFGPTAAAAMSGAVLDYNRFLDRHLKGVEADLSPVRYFLMGANEWRQSGQWPPAEAETVSWHLHSGGNANSARGDGSLSTTVPAGDEVPDRYFYDPLRPVPSEGGPTLHSAIGLPGPRDQSRIEARDDVLCYTSEPLDRPVVVAGPVKVVLWTVTDAPDTDFTAKLVDVQPNGTPISVCDGIIRARFRDSLSEPTPVPEGEPACYEIDLASTAIAFEPGHCIRLEVSSSNFPRFDANPNTGGPLATETEIWPALQYVLHDEDHPSALELCVLPD
ncbi:MAG: CocE/NonD family hydrolase [Chloroflexi bacterium]|nr:CocE/NonD family hydrolase [Chloroflexota bacterium]